MEQTGEPIGSNLAKIINNVIRTPINKEKLVKKLESHHRPENLDSLKVKKYNTEIWSEMLQSKTRSKDLKTQKLQGCILKAVGVISKVTDTLINLGHNCLGHNSVVYVDDLCLQGNTYQACLDNISDTITLLRELGFVILTEKSVLTPSQTIVFLGFIISSKNMTLSLTEEKKNKIKTILTDCL